MKLIGKGTHTKAYLRDDGKVQLHSNDPVKEVMALGWFPSCELFPIIELIDTGVYEMDYYPYHSSLKNNLEPEQWQLYQDLRHLYHSVVNTKNPQDMYAYLHNHFDKLLDKRIVLLLQEALLACSNYSTAIIFEISPRNVKVNNGKLILLDCFYLPKEWNPELYNN